MFYINVVHKYQNTDKTVNFQSANQSRLLYRHIILNEKSLTDKDLRQYLLIYHDFFHFHIRL